MDFTAARLIKAARKEHQCVWCLDEITKGTPYLRSRAFDGADAWTCKVHVPCQKAIDWVYSDGGIEEDDEVTDAYDAAEWLDTSWDPVKRRFGSQPVDTPADIAQDTGGAS